jgi:hypothetical protein
MALPVSHPIAPFVSDAFGICGYNPLVNDPDFNRTYDDILAMSTEEFWAYVEYMRTRIREVWDEQGIAPSTGWSDEDVRTEFERLNGFPVDAFWRTCELTGNRVIHNTHVLGNAVNAWNLSRMLKVRINYTEKDNGRSIYDFFAKDELFAKYKPYARRHILRDSFYFFAQTVQIPPEGASLPHRPELRLKDASAFVAAFSDHERAYGEYELLIEAKKKDKGYSGYAEHLQTTTFAVLTFAELKVFHKSGDLLPVCFRVLRQRELNDEHEFHIRMYRKGQKLFPAMFKSFRVSMCQYAVNFPPLTAKLLYQTFLKDLPGEQLTVWDPSSGWAGRILGAMSSELRTHDNTEQHLHYVGTDPNPDFYNGEHSVYADIADYYNAIRVDGSLFGDAHTHELYCSGSEMVQHNPDFRRYRGKLDLVFTSPPYFNREAYSEDENQSFKRFGTYDSWRDGFLKETLKTAYEWLKPNRCLLWNIADLKVGKKYLPLQQDSIAICKELGFEYVETIYMTLRGMPGANRVDENGELTAKNMCKVKGKLYKYEPVLVFRKS